MAEHVRAVQFRTAPGTYKSEPQKPEEPLGNLLFRGAVQAKILALLVAICSYHFSFLAAPEMIDILPHYLQGRLHRTGLCPAPYVGVVLKRQD